MEFDITYRFSTAFFENGSYDENGKFIANRRDDDSFFINEDVFAELQKEYLKRKITARDLMPYFGGGTLELITFKRAGNCFVNGGINFKNHKGVIVNDLCHSINLIGGYVIDLGTGINGLPISEYLNQLYEYNNRERIRIDYTLSQFMAYEDSDAITSGMCKYLRTGEGLDYDTFQYLWNEMKEIDKKKIEVNGLFKELYVKELNDLKSKFCDSKRGVNVFNHLQKLSSCNLLYVKVEGNFNILCKGGEIKRHTEFTVAVDREFNAYDPTHGWEPMPIAMWLSLLAPINSPYIHNSNYIVRTSHEGILDFLELKTYGDLDLFKDPKENNILSKIWKNNYKEFLDIIKNNKPSVELDISSIMCHGLFVGDTEIMNIITELGKLKK